VLSLNKLLKKIDLTGTVDVDRKPDSEKHVGRTILNVPMGFINRWCSARKMHRVPLGFAGGHFEHQL
jgi:hypothetical protein